ncbi:MAG: cell division protein SepF [Clostridia bacterium]|nr:cell division protein SepF [Clostridia bacterium]
MGLMNFIYKIFGFESDDVKVVQTKKKESAKASYNLKISKKLPDEIDGIKVFYPQTFEECKDKVELLKKNIPFFLDFRACGISEKNKILDYFQGVIAVLGATEEVVEKNLHIFLPKNMELERE